MKKIETKKAYSESSSCECTHVSDTSTDTKVTDPFAFSESSSEQNGFVINKENINSEICNVIKRRYVGN